MEFVVIDQVSASEDSSSDISPEHVANTVKNCNCNMMVEKLQEKVQDLKKQLKIFVPNKCRPPVQIIFSDEASSKQYQDKVEAFLQDLLSNKSSQTSNEEVNDSKNVPSHSVMFFNGFCVDKRDSASKPSPFYESSFNDSVLDGTGEKQNMKIKMSSSSCFNCLGDHVLRNCPLPIDRAKIAKNRAARPIPLTSSRYHLDSSSSDKIKPGVLSDDLMHALDIGQRDIPSYIYKMRILGYPPGWLREAEIDSSLKLYHFYDDDQTDDSDEFIEAQYDAKQIINYPGFNIRPKSNVVDNHEMYGCPQFQSFQLKENMKEFMESKTRGKKRKRREEKSSKKVKLENSSVNMEVTDGDDLDESIEFRSPHPKQSFKKLSSHSSDISSPDSSRSFSPSLNDLEIERKKLLSQLNDNSQITDLTSQDSVGSNSESPILSTGISITAESGSPSVKGMSGVNQLPKLANFADGIGEHLPFKNLQDSIGTFDKMRVILNEVRKRTKIR